MFPIAIVLTLLACTEIVVYMIIMDSVINVMTFRTSLDDPEGIPTLQLLLYFYFSYVATVTETFGSKINCPSRD